MTIFAKSLVAAGAIAAIAAPAAGQYYPPPYQQPYPQQPYPQQPYPQQSYPQQSYPQQGYPQNQSVIGQIIDGLIGNRYNVSDRQAIRSCGYEAMRRAQAQYGQYPRPGYDSEYPQAGGYNGQYPQAQQGYGYPGYMRIVGISDVERRSGGLRVRGLIDSGRYRNRVRGAGDLTFRCDVNYNGYVTRMRIERNYRY